MRFVFLFFTLVFTNVCSAATTLDEIKVILSEELNIPLRSYSTRDFGRDKYSNAISALVPEEQAEDKLLQIRKALPEGAIAFIGTTRSLSSDKTLGVELVAIVSDDKFDILRASRSDGINYGLTTEKIIAKLKEWDDAYGIDIWQAETDTIQLTLESLPKDVSTFAKEVYEFCPDIVDQGSGKISDISDYLEASKSLLLWWD